MKSIRPLVTITLLTVAGVFLYFKINETQPQLPPDVANWNLPSQVDIQELSAVGESPGARANGLSAYSGNNSREFLNSEKLNKAPRWNNTATGETNQGAIPTPSQSVSHGVPDLPPLPVVPTDSMPIAKPSAVQVSPAEITAGPLAGAPPAPRESLTPAAAMSTPIASAGSPPPQASLFGATRLAVQGALDRGELSQALLLLSDWYGDPSLAVEEIREVNTLLGQLAGSVIYSTEHRLEPPYQVKTGEQLEDIAKKYDVPWQLLAKINGIEIPNQLQAGQKIKVLRGPFSALIDLGDRQMTIMLDRRYAGKFRIEFDPQTTIEEGHWSVDQKLILPANLNMTSSVPGHPTAGQGASVPTEEQSLVLTNVTNVENQIALLKGPEALASGVTAEPENRVIRLKSPDVQNVYDILSVGSKVIIRR